MEGYRKHCAYRKTAGYKHFPPFFLAHRSTTCTKGAVLGSLRVRRASSTILKTSFPKPLGQFQLNLAKMFLERFSFKISTQNSILSNFGCHGNQMEFSKKSFEIVSETADQTLK